MQGYSTSWAGQHSHNRDCRGPAELRKKMTGEPFPRQRPTLGRRLQQEIQKQSLKYNLWEGGAQGNKSGCQNWIEADITPTDLPLPEAALLTEISLSKLTHLLTVLGGKTALYLHNWRKPGMYFQKLFFAVTVDRDDISSRFIFAFCS